MTWSVVESIPVHETIKTGKAGRDVYIENYKQSIENLSQCGIDIVCYNFMPVIDWTRTSLDYEYRDGSRALRFDMLLYRAFDLYVLKRAKGFSECTQPEAEEAKRVFDTLTTQQIDELQRNIIAGMPGKMVEAYSLDTFRQALETYKDVDNDQAHANLGYFLKKIIPTAQKAGVLMALHPDDPPLPLFGLPRIASTEKDIERILKAVDCNENGLTMCVGTYSSRKDNDVKRIVSRFASRVHFVHLRNVELEREEGSFTESDHLSGDVDMYWVVRHLLEEQERRRYAGRTDTRLPFRPDHGHKMMDDLKSGKKSNPGYTCIGRMRGIAELRGLQMAIQRVLTEKEEEHKKVEDSHPPALKRTKTNLNPHLSHLE